MHVLLFLQFQAESKMQPVKKVGERRRQVQFLLHLHNSLLHHCIQHSFNPVPACYTCSFCISLDQIEVATKKKSKRRNQVHRLRVLKPSLPHPKVSVKIKNKTKCYCLIMTAINMILYCVYFCRQYTGNTG